MRFPVVRPRRLRATPALRRLVRETTVAPSDLVWPLFFNERLDSPLPVKTMPGVDQLPVRMAGEIARLAVKRGLGGVLLFGLPKTKDEFGTSACDPDGPVARAIAEIKSAAPELVVITDVCVDEYTSHGHCGILHTRRDGQVDVDNDRTIELLADIALMHAKAGADIVAPSDMLDGRIGTVRERLDENGFESMPVMSYAIKYASAFYGPFRDAAECAPKFGNRASYQMDPANTREALREIALDIDEGADMLIVKPALPYLDIVRRVRESTTLPIAAYNVSGEYAMLHAAAAAGMLDLDRVVLETLTSIRRAGADMILTYHALHAAELLDA